MNKNIKLAVAGAVLALSASANAGIIIPAGDWTVDIGGNVNSFVTSTKLSGAEKTAAREDTPVQIQTGLLPSALGIGAKTRQNDLDVAVQFSFFTGSNQNGADNLSNSATSNGGLGYSSLNIRQSYLTFGDKSWGSVLVGRNLGVFGSDAILSDMTLLGVGSGAGGVGGSSTLGRIGSGYLYADWKAQMAYTTPNFGGFEATGAITEGTGQVDNSNLGYEGKASYSFAGDAVSGKFWVGGKTLKIQTSGVAGAGNTVGTGAITEFDARGGEVGAKFSAAGVDLVGYLYQGKNMDAGVGQAINTIATAAANFQEHDNNGGYIQATYVMPSKTKLGISYGKNVIEKGALAGATAAGLRDGEREATIFGAYHPLTKHLNLVAEYNDVSSKTHTSVERDNKTGSLGAILFF